MIMQAMFLDTWINGFQIMHKIIKVKKYLNEIKIKLYWIKFTVYSYFKLDHL